MSFFVKIMSWFGWVGDLWGWLINPSIIPIAGAGAAIIAAFTVETLTWIKNPLKGIGRAVRVAVVFLVMSWLICSCFKKVSGVGEGDGSGPSKPQPDPIESSAVNSASSESVSIPEDVALVLSFVPAIDDKSIAKEFCCDLLFHAAGKKVNRTEIRAKDINDFDNKFVQGIRGLKLPLTPTILINKYPSPGENQAKRLENKIRELFPNATVKVEDRNIL